MTRPMLVPGIRVLWRGPRSLQFGVSSRAVVVDLANPGTAAALDLLDGSRTEAAILAAADRRGIDTADVRALLAALQAQGLVVPAHALTPRAFPTAVRRRLTAEAAAVALRPARGPAAPTPAQLLRRRALARVRVTGPGRLGVPIALALAAAGIGHVDPDLAGPVEPGECLAWGLDGRNRPRSELATEAITRLAPETRVAALRRREDATFVVHLGSAHAPTALHALAHRRLAHLAVTIREGAALVGPLVPPAGSPCAGCVDLHRTDRDPRWPALAAQLTAGAPRPGDAPRQAAEVTEACTATTAMAAAAFAAEEVLRYLDGEVPQTLATTVEIVAAGVTRRRTWIPHPDCHCVRRAAARRRPQSHSREAAISRP